MHFTALLAIILSAILGVSALPMPNALLPRDAAFLTPAQLHALRLPRAQAMHAAALQQRSLETLDIDGLREIGTPRSEEALVKRQWGGGGGFFGGSTANAASGSGLGVNLLGGVLGVGLGSGSTASASNFGGGGFGGSGWW